MAKPTMLLQQPGDTQKMGNAIAWCAAQGMTVRRVSQHQIKIGPWNFYPDKGTFNRDDLPRKQVGGFPAFQAAISAWWNGETARYQQSL